MADNKVRIVVETDAGRSETVLNNLKKGLKDTGEAAKGSGNAFRDLGLTIDSWSNIASKAMGAVTGAVDMMRKAADFSNQTAAVRSYANSIGMSFEKLQETTKKASFGMVSDIELLKANAKALQLGVGTNVDELGKLWTIAKNKADLFGTSTSEVFGKMVDAIGRGQSRLLLELGMLPEKFSRSKDAAALLTNKAEILAAVLEQGGGEIERMGGISLSTADRIAQMDAAISDLKIGLGQLWAEGLRPTVEFLTNDVIPAVKAATDYWREYFGIIDQQRDRLALMGTAGKIAEKDLTLSELRKQAQELDQAAKANAGAPWISKPILENLHDIQMKILAVEKERAGIMGSHEKLIQKENLAAEEHKTRLDAIAASAGKVGKEKAAIRSEVDKLELKLAKVTEELVKGWGGQGVKSIEEAQNVLQAAAAAAGGLAVNLEHGVTAAGKILEKAGEISESFRARSKFGGYDPTKDLSGADPADVGFNLMDAMAGGTLSGKGFKKPSPAEVEQKLRGTIEQPLSRVFNDAFVAGLEGGDFFDALGRGLKRTVTEAFANQLTGALFGTGGAITGIFGGGSSSSSGSPAASSVGSGLGGMLDFGPIMKGGVLQTGNLGQYALAAYGVNKLFGAGGLFGSRVVHGQEAIQQASDINTRVQQASESKQRMIGMVGLSDESIRKISDLTLYTAGYTWEKSGDGIFSKKTTTYGLNAGQAQQSLAEFDRLSKAVSLEIAKREFDVGMTGLKDPLQALQMTMEDLIAAVDRTSADTEAGMTNRLSLAQMEKQMAMAAIGTSNFYRDLVLSNPFAAMGGAGGDLGLGRDPMGLATRFFSPAMTSGGSVTLDDGRTLSLSEFGQMQDAQNTIDALSKQHATAFRLSQMEADPKQRAAALDERKKYLEAYQDRVREIMDAAEKAATDMTLAVENRQAALEAYQRAIQEYYQTQQETLAIEAEAQAEVTAQRDRLTADILGTLLTRVGEQSTVNGQQVIVLSGGQPDGRALAQELVDALGGENPELAKVLGQFISQTARPYW